jgi:hypothetical protein
MAVPPPASCPLPLIITNCQNNENMLLILTINFTKKSKKTGKVKNYTGILSDIEKIDIGLLQLKSTLIKARGKK